MKSTPNDSKFTHTFVPFQVKSVNEDSHSFTGLSAAFSKDLGNDVIHPGAFKRTLDNWRSSKKTRPIPLLDSHNRWSVGDVLGKMIDGKEVDDGLESEFEFVPNDDKADAAFRRVKGGFVTGLSIGYEPVKYDYEQIPGGESWDRIRHLREVKLGEVSLVVFPMNQDARVDLTSVKGLFDAVRDGRKLSKEEKTALRALLFDEDSDDSPPAPNAKVETPPTPEAKGLAPEDTKRQELESRFDSLFLRGLARR